MKRGLGYKPSPPDARGTHDHLSLLRIGTASLPASANLRGQVVEVLDQSITSSCTAHATAQAVRCALVREGISSPPLPSRLFIYWNTRAVSGLENEDGGAYIHDCFTELNKCGFCAETEWPFDEGRVNTPPQWNAYRAAADQRVSVQGYARLDGDGADVVQATKEALAASHVVIGGTTVDDVFMDLPASSIWPGPIGKIEGGHALTIVGYDEASFLLCNSWGTSWSDGGFGRISYDALRQFSDLWVVSVVPKFSGGAA